MGYGWIYWEYALVGMVDSSWGKIFKNETRYLEFVTQGSFL